MAKSEIVKKITEYFTQMPVVECVYLFGSTARGLDTAKSDVDIAVLFNGSVPESEYTDRRIKISLDIGKLLAREIDCVAFNNAATFLKFQILRHGERIYESPHRKNRNFEGQALIEYYDFFPIKELIENTMIKRLKGRLSHG